MPPLSKLSEQRDASIDAPAALFTVRLPPTTDTPLIRQDDASTGSGDEYELSFRGDSERKKLTHRADTQTGERQFGRKAQLSNITAAKT